MLRSRSSIVAVGVAGLLAHAGCTASSEEVRPPDDQFFFPTGVAVSPDEQSLFVISANSELRYDSGTVLAVDLGHVDDVIDGWLADGTAPGGCTPDLSFTGVLECDEAAFLRPGAGVRVGNFASRLAVQDLGDGHARLVVPVRGDPSVTWIDWDGTALSCSDGGGFPLCDETHRMTRFLDDGDLPAISAEPFDVYVDSANEYGLVTHLTSGTVTLVDLPRAGTPMLSDALAGLFNANQTGRAGSSGVAGRAPGSDGDLVYVSSLSEGRVQTMTVARTAGGRPLLVPSNFFFLAINTLGLPVDSRGVRFSASGDRGYVLTRDPPAVTVLDTSIGATGMPQNRVLGLTDICRESGAMVVADTGAGDRAYVTCFQGGELYVVDPGASVGLEAIVPIGRGPFGVAAAPSRRRLYITNFFEDTIAVVDLTPGAPTQYRVVLRIGTPRSS